MNNNILPNNSKIKIINESNKKILIIPYKNNKYLRYFATAFLTVWLIGWSIAGIGAIYILYRLLKKPISEQLILQRK